MEKQFVNRPAKGFTLIELMIALLVLTILASVGIPAFQRLVADNRVSSQANATLAALHFARSEALKRRTEVSVCQPNTSSIVVRAGSGCNAVSETAADTLLVLPITPQVVVVDLPASGIVYLANGYISPFTPVTFGVRDEGNAVAPRSLRVLGSGFSEII